MTSEQGQPRAAERGRDDAFAEAALGLLRESNRTLGLLRSSILDMYSAKPQSELSKEDACKRVIIGVFSRREVLNAEREGVPMLAMIGGWAVWLKTGLRKSHDIDLAASEPGWSALKDMAYEKGWRVKSNPSLRKHEIEVPGREDSPGVDIDVYVENRDELSIPSHDVLTKYSSRGPLGQPSRWLRVIGDEPLVAMKLMWSYLHQDRDKDPIDIAGLVLYKSPKPDMHKVGRIISEHMGAQDLIGCLNHFGTVMNSVIESRLNFDSAEHREVLLGIVEGLEVQLKEGAIGPNDQKDELKRSWLSRIFDMVPWHGKQAQEARK